MVLLLLLASGIAACEKVPAFVKTAAGTTETPSAAPPDTQPPPQGESLGLVWDEGTWNQESWQ
ncbi:MAG: hypothetical protein HKN35_08585 [Woeseia sp.]|nr:hypothetical protein [Woeseia sp.]NNE60936.1 hypothetical protein [Woeseia sp.]NNL56056.1 hypothetical protein [Woeseia sp.]